MARKGREPLVEAPPPAASSSDEEASDDDEEPEAETQAEEEEQRQSSSGDGDDDEEEEDAEDNSPSPPPKVPTQKKPDSPKPAESDSDSDSDSEVPPSMVKPLESKPMSAKKSRSKLMDVATAKVTVLASPAPVVKRPGSEKDKGTPKKARREKVEPTGAPQDEGKKPLFQRLWSEDDEVAILQGIIDYKAEKGIDPMADADDFLEFVKKSLHVNANRVQIMSKVRSLKRKFETAKKKKKITDPHGLKLFELYNRIWESDEVINNGGIDRKDSSSRSHNVKRRAGNVEKSKAGKNVNGPVSEDEKEEGEEKVQNRVTSRGERELKLEDWGNFGFLKDGILREGIEMLDEGEKAKLDDKWRKQNMVEMEIYLKRLDLIRELTQKTLNAMKSA